jgi:hypothetical protein
VNGDGYADVIISARAGAPRCTLSRMVYRVGEFELDTPLPDCGPTGTALLALLARRRRG